MDSIDTRIISALRRNARISITELSAHLGVTRATIRSRIDKLCNGGEILGFTTVLKGDAHDLPVTGVMLIEVEGKGTNRVITQLDGMPTILAIHTTNGKWDLIIELGTQTLADLDAVLRDIRLIDGITNSETNLYLSTKRSNRPALGFDATA
ncbi:MAG: Lrp/AsnC family transcriptional regulator [Rhizobiaceae bacterium]